MIYEFYYVYLIRSINDPTKIYVGFTNNLVVRLERHDRAGDAHTARYRPWELITAVTFNCKEKAMAFEKYLKSSSGKAFANKHLW